MLKPPFRAGEARTELAFEDGPKEDIRGWYYAVYDDGEEFPHILAGPYDTRDEAAEAWGITIH